MGIFRTILGWSEIWIMLLPIGILLVKKEQPAFMKPVIIYLWIAFAFNIYCDGLRLLEGKIPVKYYTNTIVYNLHSFARFVCFIWFFLLIESPNLRKIQRIILVLCSLLFLVYFTIYDDFFNTNHISGDLMTGESFFLLLFSMLYYLTVLGQEKVLISNRKDFLVVTGLCLFGVINFFVFLFYEPMIKENVSLASDIWYLHNIAFIIFMLFLSKALYDTHPD